MPYKNETEHLRLSPQQDRRRKLTDEQKEEIRQLYADGKGSWQALADRYQVSRSLIGIIVNPDRADKVRSRCKEHWRDYYDQEKLTAAVRATRRYKQELYLKGGAHPGKESHHMTTTSLILCVAGAFYLTDLLFRVIDLIERPRKGGSRRA